MLILTMLIFWCWASIMFSILDCMLACKQVLTMAELRLMGMILLHEYLVINQSFGQTKVLTRWWHQMRSQRTTKVILIHPEMNSESMEVCSKCHGNPSNCCRNISFNLMGALEQKSGAHQSHQDSSSGKKKCQTIVPIHLAESMTCAVTHPSYCNSSSGEHERTCIFMQSTPWNLSKFPNIRRFLFLLFNFR